jgi:hypothetical protein
VQKKCPADQRPTDHSSGGSERCLIQLLRKLGGNSEISEAVLRIRDVWSGSWSCKNGLEAMSIFEARLVRSQAAIAAISGLIPTMFIARVRLTGTASYQKRPTAITLSARTIRVACNARVRYSRRCTQHWRSSCASVARGGSLFLHHRSLPTHDEGVIDQFPRTR